jgi:hypothetical protein
MNAGAQSAHAFIENNGRGKPNFSSFGRITAYSEVIHLDETGLLDMCRWRLAANSPQRSGNW